MLVFNNPADRMNAGTPFGPETAYAMRHDLIIQADIEGGDIDDRHPRLKDVAMLCSSLLESLHQIERCITQKSGSIDYLVKEAKTGSLLMEIVPAYNEKRETEIFETVTLFRLTVQDLQSGKAVDERLDDRALKSLRNIAKPLRHHAASLKIGGTRITSQFVESIDDILSKNYISHGSVMGTIEKLDIHGRNVFALFPMPDEKQIVCEFPVEYLDLVCSAINRKVTVWGTLKYKHNGVYPIHINVDDIDIHPEESELPTFESMRGCLEQTGGLDGCSQED